MIQTIRSLLVIIHNPFAKPKKPDGVFKHHFRVMPWDCDLNFHLTNARYPQQLDLARTNFLLKIGTAWLFAKMGWRSVLASQTLTFIREIKPLSEVTIETQVLSWDRKYLYMENRFMVEGRLHAKALARIAVLKNGRVLPFGDMLRDVAKVHKLDEAKLPQSPSTTPAQAQAMIDLLGEMRIAEEQRVEEASETEAIAAVK
ncbi:MAG: thioesterase family protein [Venatoribacter sp.]